MRRLFALIMLILFTISVSAITPPNSFNFRSFYNLTGIWNLSTLYGYVNNSEICTADNGVCVSTNASLWAIINNGTFVPYNGAIADVNLGSYDLETTGNIIANYINVTDIWVGDDATILGMLNVSSGMICNGTHCYTFQELLNNTGGSNYWNVSATSLFPLNLSKSVGIGTNNLSAYDLIIKNDDGRTSTGGYTNNTMIAIASTTGYGNASIYFLEDTVPRYMIGFDASPINPRLRIFDSGTSRNVMEFQTDGMGNELTYIYGTLIVDNITAGNICYSNGTNCVGVANVTNSTIWNIINNGSFVPYVGATHDVNLGSNNLLLNKTILFEERTAAGSVYPILRMNHTGGDGFVMEYDYDFEVPFDDWLVFRKTDGNDAVPDGGIAFVMSNASGYNHTILKLDGTGMANFTDNNIYTTGNIYISGLTNTGTLIVNGLALTQDIIPVTDELYSLGNITNWWNEAYIKTVNSINIYTNELNATNISSTDISSVDIGSTRINVSDNITLGGYKMMEDTNNDFVILI